MKKALLVLIPAVIVFAGCGPTAALGSIAAMAGTQIYNQGTGAYTTLASGMTHYAFDLVEVTNDGGIAAGKVESGHSEKKTPIVYTDNMVSISFKYVDNCFQVGLKSNTNKHSTINWNDLSLDETGKLKWKEADSGATGPSTITKGAYEEANLYTYHDKRNGLYRTLEVFSSQAAADKKGYVGKTFTLNIPIVLGDTVVTYRVKLKIAGITVEF